MSNNTHSTMFESHGPYRDNVEEEDEGETLINHGVHEDDDFARSRQANAGGLTLSTRGTVLLVLVTIAFGFVSYNVGYQRALVAPVAPVENTGAGTEPAVTQASSSLRHSNKTSFANKTSPEATFETQPAETTSTDGPTASPTFEVETPSTEAPVETPSTEAPIETPTTAAPVVTPSTAAPIETTTTDLPSAAPTTSEVDYDDDISNDDDDETTQDADEDSASFVPQLLFGNKQYRRICAQVHSSILCLTIRFPFSVEQQDPHYDYPRPVDERFYSPGLAKSVKFVDGPELLACQKETRAKSLPIDEGVKNCLDKFGANDTAIPIIWTKRLLTDKEADFYGVLLSSEQGKRVDKFFDKHIILVLGASPSPMVTKCLSSLLGRCHGGGVKPVSYGCTGHSRMLGSKPIKDVPLNETYLITKNSWYPNDHGHGKDHSLPKQNLTDHLGSMRRDPGFKELRKLSLIIEYPIAHAQNQDMIIDKWEKVVGIQEGFPRLITHAQTDEGKAALAELGYSLEHLIAFDGIPQFFPSKTGAFPVKVLDNNKNEALFLEKKGYPDWLPEYGSKCRGPLPPSSKLTEVNSISRLSFARNGLDMKFYGRTWEFANQFWFQVSGWGGRHGLDCTHSNGSAGLSCVHKYFLMAMIDDDAAESGRRT